MRKLLFLGIALLISGLSFGQSTANYTFSYAFTGSLIDISTGATTLLTGNNDDAASTVNNIGFTFYFMGTPYTQFSINSNGQLRLGSTAISGLNISSFSANTPIIAPMAGDNEVNNGATFKVVGAAPFRTLVVEWNEFYAHYTNIAGSGNMQVLLHETGQIDFIYGDIYNSSVSTVSRSIFISSSNTATTGAYVTVGATPTYTPAASPVTNTFAASVLIANLGSTAQGSRTVYTFTPPAAPTAATNLTFSNIGVTKMTLNWTDSPDETYYKIYNSTDGITYSLVSNLAANAVSYNATGLSATTLYYWKVVAATETGEAELLGSQSTIAPDPLHGIYAINNLLPTTATLLHDGTDNFNNFTDAINALNDNGISGPVSLGVIAGQTFTEDCPVITVTGTSTNTITFAKFGAGANPVIQPTGGAGTSDAGIAISGGDYFTFNAIDIAGGNAVEYGYFIKNASATDGAMNNTIANSKITLDRTNTSTRAIYQYRAFTASAASGANSTNTYHKNTIENSYQGIYMYGSSAYPDLDCIVDSNMVGAATANDIGGGSSASAGIRASYQSGIAIAANTVRNVYTSSATVSGIFVESAQGTNYVFNNNVYTISTTSTTSTNYVYGIRTDINSTYTVNVFNNMVSDLLHGIVTPSTTVSIRAIAVGVSGTGTANVVYNSVSISEDGSPSSAAFYFNGGAANLANNVFANFSTPDATSKRFCIYRGAGTLVSTYNDLYVDNVGVNNFIGYYTTDQATLAAWQVASGGQDLTSISVDPAFTSTTNLHTIASALNGTGTPVAGITIDIDGDLRDATYPDMGADENLLPPAFTCTTPAPGNTIITPGGLCLGDAVVVTLQNATPGTGVTYQWQESVDGVTFSDITGETTPALAITPSEATFYQCVVTCANGPESTPSTAAQVTFANSITSTTDGSRCGTGTVDLDATGSAGTAIYWYDAATGGNLVGTGAPWTTGPISATTSYFVSAEIANLSNVARTAPTSSSSDYWTGWGLVFDATQPIIINSVDVYPSNTTPANMTIKLLDNTGAQVAGTADVVFMPISGTGTTSQTVALGYNVPAGTGYRLVISAGMNSSNELVQETSGYTYPITVGPVSVTSNWNNSYTSTSYYDWFYNWNITTFCSSPREEVVATVVDAPAIVLTPSATTICDGDTLDLNVSSTNIDYTYSWSAGTTPATGTDVVATPNTNTNYSVTASDVSGGTYDGCVTIADVDITVNPSPSNVTATATDNDICVGTAIDLSSSAISGADMNINFGEDFETWPPTAWTFINNGTGNNWASYSNAYSGVASMSYTYNSSSAADAWAITPAQSLVSGTTYTISFMYEVAGSTFPEKLKVTVGNDATVAAQTDILWDNNGGASLTNTTWALASFTYNPLVTGDYYFGFNCYSDADMFRLYVDSVSITGSTLNPATFAWTSNPAGFASNSQDTAGVVPTATTEYIVTAGNIFGCYTSASTTVNVSSYPVVNLGADQSICDTSSITLDAQNAGATFNWSTGGTSQTEVFDGSVGAGSYDVSVEVTNATGCATSDTITITVTVCSGIEDPSMSISMYPNPATDVLNLDLSELAYGNYRFELLSLQGQQIMNEVLTNDGTIISVNLSNVAVGSYIVRVSGNNNSFQNYISIQK